MTSENFNPSKSFKLIEMDNHLNHLIKLYKFKKFPKVILMSGKKGSGKFTLVNHFLNYIFSEDTYDLQRKTIDQKSKVYNDQINNVFTNIIHLKNDEGVTTKIDDIRILKSVISKSVFNNKPRYIIIDDAELLNINSSNALLKIIEEPTKDNHFIIIDNQQKDIVDTISSRCFKMNIFLKKSEEIQIIKYLIKRFKIENELDYIKLDLTPGLFLKYNSLCFENNITNEMNYLNKIEKLLLLFKKSKNKSFINLSLLFTNHHFYDLSLINNKNIFLNEAIKKKIIFLINDFFIYNLNINSILNSINLCFKHAK